jgi:hypothetical protein
MPKRWLWVLLTLVACGQPSGPNSSDGAATLDGGADSGRTDAAAAIDAGGDSGSLDGGTDAGSVTPIDGGLADAGADAGSGTVDGGILYTPYSCADAGFGSPFDRTDVFVAPDGTNVVVTICGPRPKPLTLNVSPVDGGSAAWLLAGAAAQAEDGGAGTLLLAPGTYDFAGWDGGANWTVSGAQDMIIDGQGSTLLFHGMMSGLVISQSQRLLLRNLQIDWGEPLAVSGTLLPGSATCDGGLAFSVDPSFPQDAGAPFPIYAMSQFDVATPGWPLVPFQQAHWSQVPNLRPTYAGGQTYCVGNPQLLSGLPSGTAAIGIARTNGANAIYVIRSGNISLENVTVFASPAEAFTFYNSEQGFRMSRCRDIRNTQDPRRLISSNADGANFRQTLGSVLMEDSEMADQGDDGVSVVGQFFNVEPTSTPTSLALTPANSSSGISPGDSLTVVNGSNFATLGTARVSKVTPVSDAGIVLGGTVSLAAPGIGGLADGGVAGFWDGGVLASVAARSSPNFLIRNVNLHDNDQRGMLLHSANGLVDGCTLANDLGMILMAQDNFFLEGPGASNVTVQNTLFQNCDFMAPAATAWSCAGGSISSAPPAPLSIMTMTFDPAFPSGLPNQSINLRDNVIDGAPGMGVLVASATGVTVEGNAVINANQSALTSACGRLSVLPSGSMVALDAVNVSFSQNVRDGGSTQGLVIAPSCQGCSGQANY